MIITVQILQQAMSENGGWSAKQLRCIVPAHEYIGTRSFPISGWKKRIIGVEVSKEQIEEFLRLRKKDTREKTGNLFTQRTILDVDDQQHLDSITQEIRSA